jgi:hypothetical protein
LLACTARSNRCLSGGADRGRLVARGRADRHPEVPGRESGWMRRSIALDSGGREGTSADDASVREIGSPTGRLADLRSHDPVTGIPCMSTIPVSVRRSESV